MKVGFIGLGIMGRPMCKNLVKAGYEMVVCDFNKDAVADLVSCGAEAAANGKEVAEKCDVIITMVPNSPHVRAAVLGAVSYTHLLCWPPSTLSEHFWEFCWERHLALQGFWGLRLWLLLEQLQTLTALCTAPWQRRCV